MQTVPPIRRLFRPGHWIAWLVLSTCQPLAAQLTTPPVVPTAPRSELQGEEAYRSTPADVVEQQPRILYAPDENGNPVPLINVPLATIERLLNQQDGVGATERPPAFQIKRLSIVGVAREGFGELDVELEVSLLAPRDNTNPLWTAIPFRFHESSLLGPPEHDGEGQLHVGFSSEAGYQGWLLHDQPGEHRIRLKLAVPLTRAAESTQLRFFPPLANQSELNFEVPGAGITAEIENARGLSVEADDDNLTRLRATDLRNQVIATWRHGDPNREPPTYLDVRGDIRVTIDGPGAIRSNATLDLQSYGRPIEEFSLRLPPNTKVVSGNQPGYTVSELSPNESDDGEQRSTVQIKLEKPAPQARVQLVTQTTERSQDLSTINVASFEVIGAIRQSGRVSLLTSEEWLVYWTLGSSVRRVPTVESFEATQERKQLASFQYFRQPCQLDVQIQSQGRRVGVEPNYRMTVLEDRINLEAQLNYQVRGARISFLNFAINGWELDEIGPSGAVENDDLESPGGDPIKLRLTQATSGDLALTFKLHRSMQGTQGTLRLPLPWPAADTIKPGSLLVASADSVVLTFRPQEMSGLIQDPLLAATLALPATATSPSRVSNAPTAFRFMTDRTLDDVVIDYEVRSQEVRARMDTVMELSTETAQVTQQLNYRVLYKPVSRLQLDAPRELYELMLNPRTRGQVELRLDGQPIAPDQLQDMLEAAEESRDRNLVPLTIKLERARLGRIDIELQFAWPLRSIATAEYTPVPLATPRGAEIISNLATLSPLGPLRVEPSDDGSWLRDDDVVVSTSLQAIGMTTNDRSNLLRVRVAQRQDDVRDEAPASATIVERAWLQTWLSESERMDRAVFRFITGADTVRVELPTGAEQVVALIDGQEVTTAMDQSTLVVPLTRGSESARTLEISMSFTERPRLGKMKFQCPLMLDAIGPRRWFWQLLVPRSEHLLVAAPSLNSANRWVRDGWFWRRETVQSQSRLEYWTSAAQQPTLPSGLNEYVFSSFDNMDHLEVRTCARRSLVFVTSTLVLGLGLGLLYWPAIRHPAMIMVIATCLLAVSMMHSDVALLVAQASVLGIMLAVLSAFVWFVIHQIGQTAEVRWLNRRRADSHSGPSISWSDGSSPHSTISAPATPMQAVAPDSKA